MNASASVFHWHGSVKIADRQDNKHTPKTLHILRKALQPNPWGLTPRQAQTMDTLLKSDSLQAAADMLGISLKTIDAHSYEARKRMGVKGYFRHLLMWQEFRLAQLQPEAVSLET